MKRCCDSNSGCNSWRRGGDGDGKEGCVGGSSATSSAKNATTTTTTTTKAATATAAAGNGGGGDVEGTTEEHLREDEEEEEDEEVVPAPPAAATGAASPKEKRRRMAPPRPRRDQNRDRRRRRPRRQQRGGGDGGEDRNDRIDNRSDHRNHGDGDGGEGDDDMAWIAREMKRQPVWRRNRPLCERLLEDILPSWRDDYLSIGAADAHAVNDSGSSNKEEEKEETRKQSGGGSGDGRAVWKSVRKRIVKEFNECEPILSRVAEVVEEYHCSSNNISSSSSPGDAAPPPPPMTIIDLCSGFGIASMVLSEMLGGSMGASASDTGSDAGGAGTDSNNNIATTKVSRIAMLDRMWPYKVVDGDVDDPSASKNNGSGLPTRHITSRRGKWPVPLVCRKRNLKAARQVRHVHRHDVDPSPGPVILIGVHLCKSLSPRAIQLLQSSSKISHLFLKPCCLPGRKMLSSKIPIVWEFGGGGSGGSASNINQQKQGQEGNDGGGPSPPPATFRFGPCDVYCAEQELSSPAAAEEERNSDGTNADIGGGGGGEDDEDEEEGRQEREQQHHDPNFTNARFTRWVDLLRRGCSASGDVDVQVVSCDIQERHFQNQFLFCSKR